MMNVECKSAGLERLLYSTFIIYYLSFFHRKRSYPFDTPFKQPVPTTRYFLKVTSFSCVINNAYGFIFFSQ